MTMPTEVELRHAWEGTMVDASFRLRIAMIQAGVSMAEVFPQSALARKIRKERQRRVEAVEAEREAAFQEWAEGL